MTLMMMWGEVNGLSANDRRMAIWHTLCVRRQIRIADLAEMYQVCPRTIRYDIDALSLSHPIETVRGRYNGCVKVPDDAAIGKSPLSEEQMKFLLDLLPRMEGNDEVMLSGIIHALASQP